MALTLTREPGEAIHVGTIEAIEAAAGVRIEVVSVRGHQVRLSISAPKEQRILREELLSRGLNGEGSTN